MSAVHADTMQAYLKLSPAQLEDTMFLRKLYLTKRSVLGRKGKAIVAQMAGSDTQSEAEAHPVLNIARVADLAADLKQIAAQEQVHHYRILRAWFRGVSPLYHSSPFTTLMAVLILATSLLVPGADIFCIGCACCCLLDVSMSQMHSMAFPALYCPMACAIMHSAFNIHFFMHQCHE